MLFMFLDNLHKFLTVSTNSRQSQQILNSLDRLHRCVGMCGNIKAVARVPIMQRLKCLMTYCTYVLNTNYFDLTVQT